MLRLKVADSHVRGKGGNIAEARCKNKQDMGARLQYDDIIQPSEAPLTTTLMMSFIHPLKHLQT